MTALTPDLSPSTAPRSILDRYSLIEAGVSEMEHALLSARSQDLFKESDLSIVAKAVQERGPRRLLKPWIRNASDDAYARLLISLSAHLGAKFSRASDECKIKVNEYLEEKGFGDTPESIIAVVSDSDLHWYLSEEGTREYEASRRAMRLTRTSPLASMAAATASKIGLWENTAVFSQAIGDVLGQKWGTASDARNCVVLWQATACGLIDLAKPMRLSRLELDVQEPNGTIGDQKFSPLASVVISHIYQTTGSDTIPFEAAHLTDEIAGLNDTLLKLTESEHDDDEMNGWKTKVLDQITDVITTSDSTEIGDPYGSIRQTAVLDEAGGGEVLDFVLHWPPVDGKSSRDLFLRDCANTFADRNPQRTILQANPNLSLGKMVEQAVANVLTDSHTATETTRQMWVRSLVNDNLVDLDLSQFDAVADSMEELACLIATTGVDKATAMTAAVAAEATALGLVSLSSMHSDWVTELVTPNDDGISPTSEMIDGLLSYAMSQSEV